MYYVHKLPFHYDYIPQASRISKAGVLDQNIRTPRVCNVYTERLAFLIRLQFIPVVQMRSFKKDYEKNDFLTAILKGIRD